MAEFSMKAVLAGLLLVTQWAVSQDQPIVIQDVHVITMDTSNTVLARATVVIAEGRIQSVNGSVPKNATVVNGKGKWLMPGLIDMHVHLPFDFSVRGKQPLNKPDMAFSTQDIMTPIIANGVTTVLELNSNHQHVGQKMEIDKGYVLGPRMALAVLLDGGEGSGIRVHTPAAGRQAVQAAKVDGYDFIKVYANLSRETFMAIIDEANLQGIKVVGHIPDSFEGKLSEAFVPGFSLVAHAEELTNYAIDYSEQEAREMAKLLKGSGAWLSPTLITMEMILSQVKSLDALKALPALKYVHPLLQSKWLTANRYNKMSSQENIEHFERYVKFNSLLVKACQEARVPMMVGTDAGTSGVVAGFALHDELALWAMAGLKNELILQSATRGAAQWLGVDKQLGSIEPGKFADLVLLDENPLHDIANTRKIAGVFVHGQWLDRKQLDDMLASLARRNEADKSKFDWKTTIKGK